MKHKKPKPHDKPHHLHLPTCEPTMITAQSGLWSAAETWRNGCVPMAGDAVLVDMGHAVTYDAVSDEVLSCVVVHGTLTFKTDISTRLTVGTLTVHDHGTLTIGTEATPVNPDVTAEVVIGDVPLDLATDPNQIGTSLLAMGRVQMHGAVKTPTFTRLTTECGAGTTGLSVADAVTGWQIGDRIVVPGTKQWMLDAEPWPEEYETPVLRAVSGQQLEVDALWYHHGGPRDGNGVLCEDMLPHVGNLTRNVIVRSQNPAGTRGHTMFMNRADVDIRYAAFVGLGRTRWQELPDPVTNPPGCYSLHLHVCPGPRTPPANGYQFTLVGNCIEDNTKFGMTLHECSYGLCRDNVLYNVGGAGIMIQNGNEHFNDISHNFIVRIHGTGEERGDTRNVWVDTGYDGSGIWMRGANNRLCDNVVSNGWTYGYQWMAIDLQHARMPKFPGADLSVEGEYEEVSAQQQPILQFERNEVYATNRGLTLWDIMADCCATVFEGPDSVLKDTVLWHIGKYGFYGYAHNRIIFDGWKQYGDTVYSWSGYVNPWGLWFGDYITRHHVIRRADIQGLRVGICAPYKPGDTSDIYGADPTHVALRIEDSFVRATWGYCIWPMYAVTGGGWSLPPRTTELHNCGWQPVNAPQPEGWTQTAISKGGAPDARNSNLVQLDRVRVTQWQGADDDFEVYAFEQAPDYIVPQTGGGVTGAPESGLTNTQCLEQYGYCMFGQIAPCTGRRDEIAGYVCGVEQPQVQVPEPPRNVLVMT